MIVNCLSILPHLISRCSPQIFLATAMMVASAAVQRPLGLSQDGTYWPEKAQSERRPLGLSQDGTYWPERAQGERRPLGLSQDGTYWPERAQRKRSDLESASDEDSSETPELISDNSGGQSDIPSTFRAHHQRRHHGDVTRHQRRRHQRRQEERDGDQNSGESSVPVSGGEEARE